MSQKFKELREQYHKKRLKSLLRDYLNTHKALKDIIEYADSVSKSKGANSRDYIALYEMIRSKKPRFVLECGTGRSTMIIAQALLDNREAEQVDAEIKLISMDHIKQWQEHSLALLPDKFKDFTDICYSPMGTYGYSLVRGTVYKEVPDYPYEFVFVDGPPQGFEGEPVMCNMDFVRVVEKSEKSVSAFVDNRKHTILAYTLIFGPEKVKYYLNWGLGFVDDVSRHDMILANKMTVRQQLFFPFVTLDKDTPFKVGS